MSLSKIVSSIESDVTKLAPVGLTVVASVENTLKGASGASKKAVAVEVIGNLAKIAESSGIPTAEAVGGLVDVLVSILNNTGLFTHAPAASAPVSG